MVSKNLPISSLKFRLLSSKRYLKDLTSLQGADQGSQGDYYCWFKKDLARGSAWLPSSRLATWPTWYSKIYIWAWWSILNLNQTKARIKYPACNTHTQTHEAFGSKAQRRPFKFSFGFADHLTQFQFVCSEGKSCHRHPRLCQNQLHWQLKVINVINAVFIITSPPSHVRSLFFSR